MEPFITYALIAVTAITSIRAFHDMQLRSRMIFNPYVIAREKQYLRFLASGFIHADYLHLIVNMYVLYAFGQWVEYFFRELSSLGGLLYMLLYILGIAVSHSTTYLKHRDDPYYNSLGASGGVSAVLFSAILFYPQQKIYFVFLPFAGIPAFVFGILYLVYCQYMSRRGTDNINHDAHFAGAVFGLAFTAMIKPVLILNFIEQILP
jgi:membrane associated rhomboid family serine protease